ncbi:protein SUPPRESSOR OF GENE SILENCING 3 homolog [Triticum urartu]|uniref:Protein SUPPRESSOR OF GENE SILENCING 3 n=1 Tax=Triticum urartu TaxID=4572 RepID=A0A8R7UZU3_TRIUA|nr:protein SUPPRESSOR OF GENE SILENCING 3 homolog [Triticum urartu]
MSGGRCGGGPPGNGNNPGPGGGWETIENKKKSGQTSGRGQWAPRTSSSNAPPATARQAWNGNGSSRPSGNNWAQPSGRGPAARGNPRASSQARSTEPGLQAPNPAVTPPLLNGWQWASRPRPSRPESNNDDVASSCFDPEMDDPQVEDSSDDDDLNDDDDDMSDDYDSDASEKSFETRKTNKWFKSFFQETDTLSVDQIHERQSHCPACQNGPGAIAWFKGLESLVRHARTMGSRRVKLHRELAALLEEEMSRRGSSVVQPGEHFGKWNGLAESTDRQIVWPPMVIVMNTRLEKGEDDKWLGMGNQELLGYFSDYAVTKARHAYGPLGHRGMSVLIFESSAVGYMEAERLHRLFVHQGTDRDTWNKRRVPFLPGSKRQLYGFLALKEDMEDFNKHHPGKNRLKYEMRSHNEMVVAQLKQMSEDNQERNYLKNKVVKTKQHSKAVEESLGFVAQKHRESIQENIFVRRKAKEKHDEYEEEMKSQDQFFHDQIESMRRAMEEKEREFERLLQEERAKARQCHVDDSGTTENRRLRKEQVQRFINSQVKDVHEFEAERDELIKAHEEKKVQLKKEYMTKEMELEEEFDAALTGLMEKHRPGTFQAPNGS